MEASPTSHTPAHDVTVTVAPFRAWPGSRLIIAGGPMGPAITRLAWRRVGAIVPACRQLTTRTAEKAFADRNLPTRGCPPGQTVSMQQDDHPAQGASSCRTIRFSLSSVPSPLFVTWTGRRPAADGTATPIHFPNGGRTRLDSRLSAEQSSMALRTQQLIADLAESTDLTQAQVRA